MDWKDTIEQTITVVTEERHQNLIREAYGFAAAYSEDTTTKTGAVIVDSDTLMTLAYGANHFPEGLTPTPEQLNDRKWRLDNIIHAEPAAVFAAAYAGKRTRGATMYMPWVPCYPCAKAIIDSGIKKFVGHEELILKTPDDWWPDISYALTRMKEANVSLFMYRGKVGGVKHLFRGQVWEP